jgi:hypothetical protein
MPMKVDGEQRLRVGRRPVMESPRRYCVLLPPIVTVLVTASLVVLCLAANALVAEMAAQGPKPAEASAPPPQAGAAPAKPEAAAAQAEGAPPSALIAAPFSIRIVMEPAGKGKIIVSDGRSAPIVHDLQTRRTEGGAILGAPGGVVIETVPAPGGQAAATIKLGVPGDGGQAPIVFRSIRVQVSKDGTATMAEGEGPGTTVVLGRVVAGTTAAGPPTKAPPPVPQADADTGLKGLKSPDPDARVAAVKAIVQSRDPKGVPALVEALNDRDANVRRAAAQGLGDLDAKRAVEPLAARLKDESRDVRSEAAAALGRIGDAAAVDALIAALRDADWRVRRAAAEALGLIKDPRAVRPLTAATADVEGTVRRAAKAALRDYEETQPAPPRALPEVPTPINSNEAK